MRHIILGDDLDPNVVKLHRFINTLRPRQHGCHLTGNIFECIFLNENVWILNKISLEIVPRGPTKNMSVLAQMMAWRRIDNKQFFLTNDGLGYWCIYGSLSLNELKMIIDIVIVAYNHINFLAGITDLLYEFF